MADPITATVILSYIATKVVDKITDGLLDKGVEKLVPIIKGDKTQNAFKLALGEAIKRYTTAGSRLAIAEPLLRKDGLLTEESVIEELSQTLQFDRELNYELIGDRWKSFLESPPPWRDFTNEARILVGYLRDELKASDVFGPVMERQAIDAIASDIAKSGDILANTLNELTQLRLMVDGRLGDLMRSIVGAASDIRDNVRDFTWYINEITRDFVGRKFVFDKIETFIQSNSRGYFLIKGDPGIGKSALAAELVKRKGYIHHFNNRASGINRADAFLKNICAQLIAVYKLDYAVLPPETAQDGGWLQKLLEKVSEQLGANEKAVIVIDAMDEVDDNIKASGSNLLYLPPILPKGIYFVLTARRVDIRLRIDCDQEILEIKQDEKDNMQDIQAYVSSKSEREGIKAYIAAQEIDSELFIGHLIEKSQGNFMYLHYVLPEIENGGYKDLALSKLPDGLTNYYEEHWSSLRQQSGNSWLEYKLPIVIALSIVKEPVSIDLISDFSKVTDRRRIRSVLLEWRQFLYERKVEYEGGLQTRYRVYHDTFREFIASKDEVGGEVDLINAHVIIADTLWKELFPEDDGN